MSTITLTSPSGATCTIDLTAFLANGSLPAAPAAPKAPPAPSAPASPTQPDPVQAALAAARRAIAQPEAPEAPAKAKGPKGLAKAERKAANLALMDTIRSHMAAGRWAQAEALAAEREWETVVAQVRKARAESTVIAKAPIAPEAETDAEAMAHALLAAQASKAQPAAPKAPKATGKGRKASERCLVHNTFLRKDGTCSKCQPAPAAQPQPAAPTQGVLVPEPEPEQVLAAQEAEMFPSGLTEEGLLTHWAVLAQKPYGRNMLQSARKRCLRVVAETARPDDERTLWAQRAQAIKAILAAA